MFIVVFLLGVLVFFIMIAGIIAPRFVFRFLPVKHRSRLKSLLLIVPVLICMIVSSKLVPEETRRAQEAKHADDEVKEAAAKKERLALEAAEVASRTAKTEKEAAEAAKKGATGELAAVESSAAKAGNGKEADGRSADKESAANDSVRLDRTAATTSGSLTSVDVEPPIYLISKKCMPSQFTTMTDIVGELKNVSSQPIDDLDVVLKFRDNKGTLVDTKTLSVRPRPLMPGAITTFKGFTQVVGIASCDVSFRQVGGPEIQHRSDKNGDATAKVNTVPPPSKKSQGALAAKAGPAPATEPKCHSDASCLATIGEYKLKYCNIDKDIESKCPKHPGGSVVLGLAAGKGSQSQKRAFEKWKSCSSPYMDKQDELVERTSETLVSKFGFVPSLPKCK